MKKRVFAICTVLAMLFACVLPTFAAEGETAADDYDALAVAAGYEARVGTAEEAYDGGTFTGYFKFNLLTANNGREGTLDAANDVVKPGDTVTLIANVTVDKEISVRNRFTLDGNGKTLVGGFRAADDGGRYYSDVTLKNLTIETSLSYVAQINLGHKMTFENCTIVVKKSPAFGYFIARGELTMKDCTISSSIDGDLAKDFNQAFLIDQHNAVVTLDNVSVSMPTGKDTAICLAGVSTLNLRGTTTLNGSKLKICNKDAVINCDSTIEAAAMPIDNDTTATINTVSAWDGKTFDTSWYQAGTLEYTLDSAAKVAGLAKLCAEKKTADFPSKDESALVTFYITCDIDLGGFAWTPIGVSYAYRFQGHIIGKKNGVEGAPITVYDMSIPAIGQENVAFVGTADAGSTVKNLIFVDSFVDGNEQTAATVVGYARGQVGQEPVRLENIQVLGGTVRCTKIWGGGLVAYSKYSPVELTNCVFVGDVIATSGSQIGGLVGGCEEGNKDGAFAGAIITNCYAGGTISAKADSVGAFIGQTTAKAKIVITDSQSDMLISNANVNTGSLVGAIGTSKATTNELTLTRVLVSGLSFEKTEPANGFALVGKVNGDGTLNVTATSCVTNAKLALYGVKADGATVSGGTDGVTVPTYADLTSGDADKGAALIGAKFTASTNKYPVLSIARSVVTRDYGYADYAWIDLNKTELEIATVYELIGFSNAVKAYNFAGLTVKLSEDIDGSSIPCTLPLGTVGTIGSLTAECIGTFDKNGHTLKSLSFTTGGEIKYTVIWDWNNGDETAKTTEEYKYNEVPSYKGETPTRESDDQYSYTFNGWDKKLNPVTADITFKAVWKKTALEKPTDTTEQPTTETPSGEAPTAETPNASSDGCASSAVGICIPLCVALVGAAALKGRRREQ